LGYVMVARNYRSARSRGEIDLIGWDRGILCFIEVKTRTSRRVKPAEAAADYDKQRELWFVAREYLRHLATGCAVSLRRGQCLLRKSGLSTRH
jgi:putative endonuclease